MNHIPNNRVKTKHALFFGKKKSGKSAVINVLKNTIPKSPFYVPSISPQVHEFSYKSSKMMLYDAPGFDNVGYKNGDLKEKILSKLMEKTSVIDDLFFVISLQEGIKEEDVVNLEIMISLFKGYEKNINFVLTFADRFNVSVLDNLKDHILDHPKLKHLSLGHKPNFFYLGFLQPDQRDEDLRDHLSRMREKLLDHINSNQNDILLTDTFLFKTIFNDFMDKYNEMSSSFVDLTIKQKNFELTKNIFSFEQDDVNSIKVEIKKNKLNFEGKKRKFGDSLFLNKEVHPDIYKFLLNKILLDPPRLRLSDPPQFEYLKAMLQEKNKEIELLKNDRLSASPMHTIQVNEDLQDKLLRPKKIRLTQKVEKITDSLLFNFLVVIAFVFIILKRSFFSLQSFIKSKYY